MDNNDIEIYKQNYFEFDEPVPFKKFTIYPVRVRDYYHFYWAIDCLTLEKNKDINGIAMSHLGYLLYKIQAEPDKHYGDKFANIINICFKITDGVIKTMYDLNGQPCLAVGNHVITKEDFDDIRKIICYQNMPHYDDSYIDPDLEEDLRQKREIENKNIVQPDLEVQRCCISSGSAYKIEELNEMTLRNFVLLLQKIDCKLHYRIYKANENSGAVTFKGGLDHWIYQKKKSNLDSLVSFDSFKQKMSGVLK
jgi:hypothetical protein